jgi:hypothetical protein
MSQEEEVKLKRLGDIQAIHFGSDLREITSTLNLVLTLYENNDDADIIGACKAKLEEGIILLDEIGSSIKERMMNRS